MKHPHLLLLFFCIVLSLSAFAQEQEEESEDKSALEKMIRDRNYPGNSDLLFGQYAQEMMNYRSSSMQQLTANWSYVNASGNFQGDVGRTNSITLDTLNNGRFYVCTPHSGVWLTNNDGISYTPITEALPTQSTSCLVIDPSNTNVLYLATGAHNNDLPANSMGVFKSSNGGTSWNATGLSFSPGAGITIGEMIINPQNYNSLLAATSDGLYRTFNSGTTWTKILTSSVTSVRFKPGDTTVIYTVGTSFYRSVNSGASFTQISTGIYTPYAYYGEFYLRTSASTPNVVYLSALGTTPSYIAKQYIHKSVNSGLSFTVIDSLIGQVGVPLDVSQITPDKYVTGYQSTFKKNSTSSSLQQITQPSQGPNYPYMHADQRGISFDPRNDNVIYFCNDGGLYRTTDNGITFQNITGNMQLAHLYTFASSQQTNYKMLTAPLDVYPYIIGSSGIDRTFLQLVEAFSCQMSPLNDSIYWVAHQNPLFTQDDGTSFYNSTHPALVNVSYQIHDFQYSECDENVSYFAMFNNVYKSTDHSLTYLPLVNITNASPLFPKGFCVSRANPEYIYLYYQDSVYVTTTGTNPLTNITAGLPVGSAVISHLVVDPTNEKHIWLSYSGYSAGNKVFYSQDAGQTWTNISAGLPNVPVNALVCQRGVPGAIYAGTDGGVFYRDNTFSSWQYYNTGLPNVMVTSLDIQYQTGKLRASTFGRGVWESNLYQPTPPGYMLAPVPLFTTASTNACPGELLTFYSTTCGAVDSLRWLFPGASPATSASASPLVSYASPGSYSVVLIAYGPGGSDTLTKSNYIDVAAPLPIPYYEPVADLNQPVLPAGSYTTDTNGDQVSWTRGWWPDGSSGPGDDFLYFDNYNANLNGLEERIFFPLINLTGTAHPRMYFYRAYQRKNTTNNDTLKVYAKSCGGTEIQVYSKGGAQLANVPGFFATGWWYPYYTSDWVRDSVDLLAFAGQPSVTISFANKGYSGQVIYIDEFLLQDPNGATGANDIMQQAISVYPNPADDKLNIRSGAALGEIIITDMLGRKVLTWKEEGPTVSIDISALAKGIYFLHMKGAVTRIEKF